MPIITPERAYINIESWKSKRRPCRMRRESKRLKFRKNEILFERNEFISFRNFQA